MISGTGSPKGGDIFAALAKIAQARADHAQPGKDARRTDVANGGDTGDGDVGGAALRIDPGVLQKRAEADSLIKRLQSSRTDIDAERKEQARQKLERLKAQMVALRMMAAGDPKAAARQAAHVARELAQAAREYAGSGGGVVAADGAGAAVAAGGNVQGGQDGGQDEAQIGANVAAGAVAAVAGMEGAQAAPVEDEAAQGMDAATGAALQPEEDAGVSVAGAALDGDGVRDLVQDGVQDGDDTGGGNASLVMTGAPTVSINDDDRLFAAEARSIANELKRILKRAEEKDRSDSEAARGLRAVSDAEKSLSDIEGGMFGTRSASVSVPGVAQSGVAQSGVTATGTGGAGIAVPVSVDISV